MMGFTGTVDTLCGQAWGAKNYRAFGLVVQVRELWAGGCCFWTPQGYEAVCSRCRWLTGGMCGSGV